MNESISRKEISRAALKVGEKIAKQGSEENNRSAALALLAIIAYQPKDSSSQQLLSLVRQMDK